MSYLYYNKRAVVTPIASTRKKRTYSNNSRGRIRRFENVVNVLRGGCEGTYFYSTLTAVDKFQKSLFATAFSALFEARIGKCSAQNDRAFCRGKYRVQDPFRNPVEIDLVENKQTFG